MKIRSIAALGALLALTACENPTETAGGNALVNKGSRWDAAKTCQKGGYADFTREDGTPFTNVGECVSYAQHGGTLVPVSHAAPPPVITTFAWAAIICDVSPSQMSFTVAFTGGTGTLTGGTTVEATSGALTTVQTNGTGIYVLTVTNADGVSVSQTISLGVACTPENRRTPTGKTIIHP